LSVRSTTAAAAALVCTEVMLFFADSLDSHPLLWAMISPFAAFRWNRYRFSGSVKISNFAAMTASIHAPG